MARLRLMTAGESHGPALVAILEGLPHGLRVDEAAVNSDLKRRQGGYGRGGRMKIEKDLVQVLAGLRGGVTLGAPLAMMVPNADFANWTDVMHPFTPPAGERAKALTRPRPGHADLAGALKLGLHDARDVLERSSARSTTARVAAGAVCKALLGACGIELLCHVTRIAEAAAPPLGATDDASLRRARDAAEASEVRCIDERASAAMIEAIKAAQKDGDSVGGVVEVVAWNVPPGLGSHVEWTERLDGRIAMALMSIQAMKGVEIGTGFAAAATRGSALFDPILHDGKRFVRPTNNMGGLEGGITNGQDVVVRGLLKPISTLRRPLESVDLATRETALAAYERSDVAVAPAAGVVGEAMVALVLAQAFLEKFGGDSLGETRRNFEGY
ncbi:MAG TPA: chorismate synthase, partial [Polyangia bacterium]